MLALEPRDDPSVFLASLWCFCVCKISHALLLCLNPLEGLKKCPGTVGKCRSLVLGRIMELKGDEWGWRGERIYRAPGKQNAAHRKSALPLWLIHKSKPSSGRPASTLLWMKTEQCRKRPPEGRNLQVKGWERGSGWDYRRLGTGAVHSTESELWESERFMWNHLIRFSQQP